MLTINNTCLGKYLHLIVLTGLFSGYVYSPAFAGTGTIKAITQQLSTPAGRVEISIPKGYTLDLLSSNLRSPRLINFAENGDLFIGSRSGAVYRLQPPYTEADILVSLNDYPHSVALRQGEMFIAQTHGLYRAPYLPGQDRIKQQDLQLVAKLPGGPGHNSRTVRIGPDGKVYVSLGIAGNCSDQYLDPSYPFEDRRGGVLVLDESQLRPVFRTFASGLRNPVGFDWQPDTDIMYASNNGPDHLGYEQPPEYFSKLIPQSFHGMPWFWFDGTKMVRDHCVGSTPPRIDANPPVATFPARNAPMAVAFVPNGAMDERFRGDAIVALHGSWATQPTGGFSGEPKSRREPKLVVVRFEDGQAVRVDDLLTGFQSSNGDRWARPVGVAIGPDGALYFTSDSGLEGLFRLRRNGLNSL
ncbi:MAG: sorbosone dehydrogenase family protein [Gammaproteobacteria bacterium]|nr:MAG: sorbosone dehydrogenase family protein [Gammaproteobacteria bacterium]